jgi:hypothetical protein
VRTAFGYRVGEIGIDHGHVTHRTMGLDVGHTPSGCWSNGNGRSDLIDDASVAIDIFDAFAAARLEHADTVRRSNEQAIARL